MHLRLEKTLVRSMRPHLQHLKSSKDLVTTYEATRAGFVSLALEKNRRATPFIEQARSLKAAANKAKAPADLLKIDSIRLALLTAAGVSDKALNHLTDTDKVEAIQGLIGNFLEPAGDNFVEELVYRFLITRGDTLGGSMRNVGGALAQRKLARAIISALAVEGVEFRWQHSQTKGWADGTGEEPDIELYLRAISWKSGEENRTAVFNLGVPVVKNNVDLCLLECAPSDLAAARKKPSLYVALGELKGGIDPAGADEHWKTADSALSRIRKAFARVKFKPRLFFVGAAIEKKMSREIWSMLRTGSLTNAANLTNDDHVASISRWLCSL